MSQIHSFLIRIILLCLSSYQRLAAKKALIGTTQVMYLRGEKNQKREFGWTADENKAIKKNHNRLKISYITYISKVILTGDTTCMSRKEGEINSSTQRD
jgi:hypothetical protein